MDSTDVDHAINDLLDSYLQSKGDAQEQAAYARRLVALCKPDSAEEFCWTLWQAFIDSAKRVTGIDRRALIATIDRLVHLAGAVKQLDPLKHSDGSVVTTWGGSCWQDLPMLGPQMRENWNDDPSRPLDVAAHVNRNILAARLTALQVLDYSLYGLWALRETLEGETPWCPALPVELTMPSAHAWVMCAGEVLVKLDDDRGKPGQGGSLWTGQNGFCKARWSFWASRFDDLSCDKTLSDENSNLAREAAFTMSELLTSAQADPQ